MVACPTSTRGSNGSRGCQNFTASFIDWVPDHLTNDLRENGAKSWPEVAKILDISI